MQIKNLIAIADSLTLTFPLSHSLIPSNSLENSMELTFLLISFAVGRSSGFSCQHHTISSRRRTGHGKSYFSVCVCVCACMRVCAHMRAYMCKHYIILCTQILIDKYYSVVHLIQICLKRIFRFPTQRCYICLNSLLHALAHKSTQSYVYKCTEHRSHAYNYNYCTTVIL